MSLPGEYAVQLDDFPVMAQETAYTCNIVSMAIVMNYLGGTKTERDLRHELALQDHSTGMLPSEYLDYANQAFESLSLSATLVNPTSQAEILNVISQSLENEMPVVILYSAPDDWNKPHYNTHYSVIYGIDMNAKTVKISNPYGYSQDITFPELFEGLEYSNYVAEPFLFRLRRRVGMIDVNNIFIFRESK